MAERTSIPESVQETAAPQGIDPETAIAVILAQVEILRTQAEMAWAQVPDSAGNVAAIRDLSPLGRHSDATL